MDKVLEIHLSIKKSQESIKLHFDTAKKINCDNKVLEALEKALEYSELIDFENLLTRTKTRYFKQFDSDLIQILNALPYGRYDNLKHLSFKNKDQLEDLKRSFDNSEEDLVGAIMNLEFNLNVFTKISFFESNVVVVGANGSGKTTLSSRFRNYLQNNGVVLSAQRILFLSDFQSIAKPKKTAEDLKISQQKEKSSKKPEELQFLQNEFSVIVKNLISDNLYNSFLYRQKSLNQSQQKQNISPPKSTNLDQTIEIWNFLISHRRLGLSEDGTNLEVEVETGIKPYPASDLSDGEKVILYFISQVIQAPKNGFIVIDEPEMYLHKTILNKLWDILESHRQDCVFIYLTHDLEFAVSRTAKKVWVKEFKFPEFWEIEVIEENEIPESLLLELLGSRKNILFCEGDEESRDFRIYSQLFPWLTVMHVGGCFEVINYTKAFNKLQNVSTRALGIIDSDHRDPAQLKSLAKKHVFALSVAEVENLLLDEDFLAFFLVKNQISADRLQILKSAVITDLQKKQEIQISNYVSTKIDFYFKSTHPKKGNDLNGVKDNFQSFTSKIDIEKWYDERKVFLDEIISKKDYDKAITIFNNKDGLIQLVESKLKVSNFVDKCITLLQSDKKSHPPLHKHFPKDILQLR